MEPSTVWAFLSYADPSRLYYIFILTSLLALSALLALAVTLIAWALSIKSSSTDIKLSPFECGFQPLANRWQGFSVQFFLVSLIFLIFDIELILLYPIIPNLAALSTAVAFGVFLGVLIALTLGYVLEWSSNQLEWYEFKGS